MCLNWQHYYAMSLCPLDQPELYYITKSDNINLQIDAIYQHVQLKSDKLTYTFSSVVVVNSSGKVT